MRNDDFWLRRPLRSTRVVSIDIILSQSNVCFVLVCLYVTISDLICLFPAEFVLNFRIFKLHTTNSQQGWEMYRDRDGRDSPDYSAPSRQRSWRRSPPRVGSYNRSGLSYYTGRGYSPNLDRGRDYRDYSDEKSKHFRPRSRSRAGLDPGPTMIRKPPPRTTSHSTMRI